MKVAPAKVEVRGPGALFVSVAALELRNAIVGAKNTTGHAQGWLFGYNERYLKMELGTCFADISTEKLFAERSPVFPRPYRFVPAAGLAPPLLATST